jgi:predicted AAA+ superfamily ATPase
MIQRPAYLRSIREKLRHNPIVALLGPRQAGKTTLARQIAAGERSTVLDLEDPKALARLEHPASTLEPLRGLVVIDEVQRKPELLPILRVLADRKPARARFLVDLHGFDLEEVGAQRHAVLWLRGGFPLAYLARSDGLSADWRSDFIKTFLERDIPQLGITVPATTLRRFWTMVAHFHGQVWNAADPARSLGVNESTVRRYLDWLTQTCMVRQLQPWHENLGKRQVKSPKIYFRDSGLLHTLMGIRSEADFLRHPRIGASWEGFALEQVLRLTGPDAAYFWATHTGAELDLLMFKYGKRVGVEFKRADAPDLTRSMQIAMQDLKLDALYAVYPGKRRYHLAERIEAVPLAQFAY